jgi:hypothetical protein
MGAMRDDVAAADALLPPLLIVHAVLRPRLLARPLCGELAT